LKSFSVEFLKKAEFGSKNISIKRDIANDCSAIEHTVTYVCRQPAGKIEAERKLQIQNNE
jgi:hypothetical protein